MKTEKFKSALLSTLMITSIIALAIPLLSTGTVHATLNTHVSIYISGDGQFNSAHGVNGGGNGSAGSPYIIENWAISAKSVTQYGGIDIEYTTKYFIIRNCLVENYTGYNYGIYLENAINGRVEHCTCDNTFGNIEISDSSNDNIDNNTCYGSYTGIELFNSNNTIVDNNTCSHNMDGISLTQFSAYNTINNNTCNSTYDGIVAGYSSRADNNTISNNTCDNSQDVGIEIWNSYNNTVSNNTCDNSYSLDSSGIRIGSCHNSTINNNTCENNNYYGIYVELSGNNLIFHNNIENNGTGQAYDDNSNYWDNGYPSGGNYYSDYNGTDNNGDGIGDTPYHIPGGSDNDHYPLMRPYTGVTHPSHAPIPISGDSQLALAANGGGSGTANDPYIIKDWAINASGTTAIDVANTTAHFVVTNVVITGGISDNGIIVENVTNGDIENSTISNVGLGLLVDTASNVRVIGITMLYGASGMRLNCACDNITVENNTVEYDSGAGIYAENTENSTISGNTCSNDNSGIYTYLSNNNTIENNTCDNNTHDGISQNYENNNTLSNNTCDNNDNAGIYINYSDPSVTNCICRNNKKDGIGFWGSPANFIDNNICENNTLNGIYLFSGDNSIVTRNTCRKNRESGIYFNNTKHGLIENNTCDNNNWFGIGLKNSDNNTVRNNTCCHENWRGISIYGPSHNNLIYHNNFVNNAAQAYDNGTNYWDNGYPSGGNYWSDYAGSDSNGDGIGDTPENIPGSSNQDHYPLVLAGSTTIHLENLYKVNLYENLLLRFGSKLVMEFYKYDNITLLANNTIHIITPPQSTPENENVPQPRAAQRFDNGTVQIATLVLTTDNENEVISTIASFTVHQTDLRGRITAILKAWGGQPEQQNGFRAELTDILKQWGSAPS